jgi:hypothetical protein
VRIEDLEKVMRVHPDTLIVGTGYFGRMAIDPLVLDELKQKGIQVLTCRTMRACDEFNRLCATQNVVAALHLTC